jgi:hypothetical protein
MWYAVPLINFKATWLLMIGSSVPTRHILRMLVSWKAE